MDILFQDKLDFLKLSSVYLLAFMFRKSYRMSIFASGFNS